MKETLFSAGLATVFMLCAQPAAAGTQIYVNFIHRKVLTRQVRQVRGD